MFIHPILVGRNSLTNEKSWKIPSSVQVDEDDRDPMHDQQRLVSSMNLSKDAI
jgi:hypothetical protein